MKRSIKEVRHTTPCPSCNRARVRVTFDGEPVLTISVHDDGSFVEYLDGETNE